MAALLELTPEIIADKEPHDGPCCADGLLCSAWLDEFRAEYRQFAEKRIKETYETDGPVPF